MSGDTKKMRKEISLTEGSILKGLISFSIPLFLGQLLQQLYNMVDAWVVGNFASNDAFAAVSMAGNVIWIIIGLIAGISAGGGVVISRYYGAKDEEGLAWAIHSNLLFGIIASVFSTAVGLVFTPWMLGILNTPESVMPDALAYLRLYFCGVSTIILYNICMAIMRAVGDSVRPLYYLIVSTIVNMILDLIFVAGFQWGAGGAAFATVIAQGVSVLLCFVRMRRGTESIQIRLAYFKYHKDTMAKIIHQGLPSGIQNSIGNVGNMVIQSMINSFGAYAISGYGAYQKIEGVIFLPIMSMSMALPTFISQNLGAGKIDRAKRGALIGSLIGTVFAELLGLGVYLWSPYFLRIFVSAEEAISYGSGHARIVAFFFFLLSLTHCSAGILRGCGKSVVPMLTLILGWCVLRSMYVIAAIKIFPTFATISWAYPLTWSFSAIILTVWLFFMDWKKAKI